MASEIMFQFITGRTCEFLVRNRISQVWNTNSSAFESYLSANYSQYVISTVEQGTSSFFVGNFPSAIVPGTYAIVAKNQVGGSALETDPTIAAGNYEWNGSTTLPLSDLATSGQLGQFGPLRLARGVQVLNFPFKMVSAADHITPGVSGSLSGQISKDGNPFQVLQSGAFSEIGLGWYKLQALTSGDLLCNTAALVVTGGGVSGPNFDQRDFGFVLQKTSGQ